MVKRKKTKKKPKTALKYFSDVNEVQKYVWLQALSSLQEDLDRMQKEDDMHYTREDVARCRQRLSDVHHVHQNYLLLLAKNNNYRAKLTFAPLDIDVDIWEDETHDYS